MADSFSHALRLDVTCLDNHKRCWVAAMFSQFSSFSYNQVSCSNDNSEFEFEQASFPGSLSIASLCRWEKPWLRLHTCDTNFSTEVESRNNFCRWSERKAIAERRYIHTMAQIHLWNPLSCFIQGKINIYLHVSSVLKYHFDFNSSCFIYYCAKYNSLLKHLLKYKQINKHSNLIADAI